jgi:hypothetical protein
MRDRKTMHFPPAIIYPPSGAPVEPITNYEAKTPEPDGIDLSFVWIPKTKSNLRLWANMKLVLKPTFPRKPASP